MGILKGVVVFFADMIRAIPIDCQIDFMAVSSYGSGTESSGVVRVKKDLSADIEGRHVVILEDILDYRPHPAPYGGLLNAPSIPLRSRSAPSWISRTAGVQKFRRTT